MNDVETHHIDGLNLDVPVKIEGVESQVLIPKQTWSDHEQNDKYLQDLIEQFKENFKKFSVSKEIVKAGPA